jgi:hypothetical protein
MGNQMGGSFATGAAGISVAGSAAMSKGMEKAKTAREQRVAGHQMNKEFDAKRGGGGQQNTITPIKK